MNAHQQLSQWRRVPAHSRPKQSSLSLSLCLSVLLSLTHQREDYAAAPSHLVSRRMRLWREISSVSEAFFPSLLTGPPTGKRHRRGTEITSGCSENTSLESWIIPETTFWNHELGVRAMGESGCTCTRFTTLRVLSETTNTRVKWLTRRFLRLPLKTTLIRAVLCGR